jgi:glucose-1-phosphate thymidylyltransferase
MGELVGLVPAAGYGRRTAFLPCSKELFPVGFASVQVDGEIQRRPKPVATYVLDRLAIAGASRIIMVISPEKYDIVRYFRSGTDTGIPIAYLIQEAARGMPFALSLARPWLGDETILFGMPDTIFSPPDAFCRLLTEHVRVHADVSLGLFPTDSPHRFGMVEFESSGRATLVIDKPHRTDLAYLWGIACWGPIFTAFLAETLDSIPPSDGEVVLGDIFQAAILAGLHVNALPFVDGEYIDIGTSETLARAINRFSR